MHFPKNAAAAGTFQAKRPLECKLLAEKTENPNRGRWKFLYISNAEFCGQ